ncbi:MAG: nucleotidyl transferase AbiEii/AbiGii toxin family protein [Chloroflexia bacterium]|nr:nucleotidyl transferase AbiEii/AbiGii toxin family protein [Chloroflexia bacterium]
MADLINAQDFDLGDFFSFSIETRKEGTIDHHQPLLRFHVRAELAGRVFEEITLDVGLERSASTVADSSQGPDLLAFADIEPITVPLLPLEEHTAEKVHAYSRLYEHGRPSSRVKDLLDLILIRSIAEFEAARLQRALDRTFRQRGTHLLPRTLPSPPSSWSSAYRNAAQEIGLELVELHAGYAAAAAFLNPALGETVVGTARWDHVTMVWRSPT